MPSSKNIELQLKVQGAQHRLHSTSWYKDVRDWQKRCICLDNLDSGIILLENFQMLYIKHTMTVGNLFLEEEKKLGIINNNVTAMYEQHSPDSLLNLP
ncbi:hypothetical protein RhiirC2_769806 [Rhizophagus irregularis]|uniref:Uncharacterized protein n=1 Tax=Rhizophagus irregularis TaxID=588596 RepID=A0A2N1NY99_9GLOM|nr:hypothetical protein RhiirC2_769806 [Rhizophagus irregularis]